jgi:hypothetical protein
MPFAWTRDIRSPDEDHEARAKRVAQAIRQTGDPMVLPVLWQDNEAIHQDTLERELILPDDTPMPVRYAATQRWMALAQQASMKQMGMMAPPNAPGGPSGGGPGQPEGQDMSSIEQPFASTNPGVAAPASSMSDEDRAARQFDGQQRAMEQQ